MSRRLQERAQGELPIQVTVAGLDITTWNGVPVSPAVLKSDGLSPNVTVPEMGAIIQAVNTQTGNLDRARIVPANTAPGAADPALVVASSPNAVYPIGYANTTAIDAFARLRVSQPLSLFDSNLMYNTDPLFWSSSTSGGASIVYVAIESAAELTVTAAAGDKVVRQSYQYTVYQPGKSQLLVATGTIGAAVANIRKAIGYFDTYNGVFFEQNAAGVLNVALRSRSGGTTYIPQASWNVDPLDGSGPSGFNLDVTKANIFWIDLEWLGVGRVRFGVFSPQGIPIVCHQIENANANPSTYMETASLPVRYEIEVIAGAASGAVLRQICSAVMSEGGGENPQSFSFGVPYTAAAIAVNTTDNTAIFSIRPRATFGGLTNRVTIVPESVELVVTGNNPTAWSLIYDGTFSAAPTWVDANTANSATQYALDGGNIVPGTGIVVASGFAINGAGTNARVAAERPIAFSYPLTLDLQGLNPKVLTLAAQGLGGNASVRATINWREYR